MKKIDERTAKAICQMESLEPFTIVREWIYQSLTEKLTQNIDERGEEATRSQGYAEALRDIKMIFENSRTIADKFRK